MSGTNGWLLHELRIWNGCSTNMLSTGDSVSNQIRGYLLLHKEKDVPKVSSPNEMSLFHWGF
jgi:hypothetical protein